MSDEHTPAGNADDAAVPEVIGGPDGTSDLAAMLGGVDFGALLGAAQDLQAQMVQAQEEMAATVVEGTAGGGLVRIGVTGDYSFESVAISPDAVDPADPSLLDDLVLAALRDACAKVEALRAQAQPFGDAGGLGNLFGG